MMPLNAENKNRWFMKLWALGLLLCVSMFSGCGEDSNGDGAVSERPDTTIPINASYDITALLELDDEAALAPELVFAHTDDRLFMAWIEVNSGGSNDDSLPYRIRCTWFDLNSDGVPQSPERFPETVVELENLKGKGGLSMAVSGGMPMIAYAKFKAGVVSDGMDYNNQGDVMVAIRDGEDNWRNEVAAFGYIPPDRNPALSDGLAGSDFSLAADGDGNALLAFQFYYEGIDSYNMEFPDLRFIRQPVNHFNNSNAEAVADYEKTVEGNIYFANGSGIQNNQGRANHVLMDPQGNVIVFYYADTTHGDTNGKRGLRIARTMSGIWQPPQWIETGIDILDIDADVNSEGKLFAVYTVKDAYDTLSDETIPYTLRYAEEVEAVSGDDDGDEVQVVSWQTGYVNHTSINGRFCSLALDFSGNPVIAYFDEMNFTQNRFFSRIKISARGDKGAWNVDVINPEDVGLSNTTNPYDISPGAHDDYYIGKYNYLWVDRYSRVNVCSYSTITHKAYHFVQK